MSDEETMIDEPILTPDFTDAVDFEVVPEGRYPVRVVKVEGPIWPKGSSAENPFRESGQQAHPMLVVSLEIFNRPDLGEHRRLKPWRAALSGEYAGFLLDGMRAIIPGYQKGDQIVKAELIGATCTAVVSEDIYDGKPTNNVDRLVELEEA